MMPHVLDIIVLLSTLPRLRPQKKQYFALHSLLEYKNHTGQFGQVIYDLYLPDGILHSHGQALISNPAYVIVFCF